LKNNPIKYPAPTQATPVYHARLRLRRTGKRSTSIKPRLTIIIL